LPEDVELIEREQNRLTVRIPKASAPALTAQMLGSLPVVDLTVQDPPIEIVIDQIYQNSEVLDAPEAGA